mmetsp:Transcript_136140/g.435477  ORF Transcript_136140/g.435477 Transcript_136140/m.435477 type:complete len:215 (+) Transcript_136140:2520-3164(+)
MPARVFSEALPRGVRPELAPQVRVAPSSAINDALSVVRTAPSGVTDLTQAFDLPASHIFENIHITVLNALGARRQEITALPLVAAADVSDALPALGHVVVLPHRTHRVPRAGLVALQCVHGRGPCEVPALARPTEVHVLQHSGLPAPIRQTVFLERPVLGSLRLVALRPGSVAARNGRRRPNSDRLLRRRRRRRRCRRGRRERGRAATGRRRRR